MPRLGDDERLQILTLINSQSKSGAHPGKTTLHDGYDHAVKWGDIDFFVVALGPIAQRPTSSELRCPCGAARASGLQKPSATHTSNGSTRTTDCPLPRTLPSPWLSQAGGASRLDEGPRHGIKVTEADTSALFANDPEWAELRNAYDEAAAAVRAAFGSFANVKRLGLKSADSDVLKTHSTARSRYRKFVRYHSKQARRSKGEQLQSELYRQVLAGQAPSSTSAAPVKEDSDTGGSSTDTDSSDDDASNDGSGMEGTSAGVDQHANASTGGSITPAPPTGVESAHQCRPHG